MAKITILSWNVNGIRAIGRSGFVEWITGEQPDILCVQETKAWPEQVPQNIRDIPIYQSFWHKAERKGYSGVACYCKFPPKSVTTDFGDNILSREGRTMLLEFGEFSLINVYFPNGQQDASRLRYKMDFYDAFLEYVLKLQCQGRNVIFCGDVNTAHKEIDLARPKENRRVSGFLPEECAWLDRVVAAGFIDTFRRFNDRGGQYSWWDLKSRARERNVGWRIDYFFAHRNLSPYLRDAFIRPEVMGSDHCPVGVVLEFL